MKISNATLRYGVLGVLTSVALGGAAAVAAAGSPGLPAAGAASDPCAASEIAKTVGVVAKSTGDYLDSHPETNQAMTHILQQPAGPQSAVFLKSYFETNPKAVSDLQTISQPLTGLSTKCQLPLSLPQVLTLMQAAQGQGGLPAGALPVPGAQGIAAVGAAPATAPAATGPLPGPAPAPKQAGG